MSSSPTTKLYLDVDGSNTDGGGSEIIFNTSASAGTPTAYNAKISGTRASNAAGSSELSFWTTLASSDPAPQKRMTINKNGNVGIGDTSPSSRLDVKGTTTDNSAKAISAQNSSGTELFYVRNDGVVSVSNNYLYAQHSSGAYFEGSIKARGGITDDGGTLGLGASGNTSQLNIVGGGNVGIGTTSPGYKLDVNGSVNTAFGATNGYRINTNRVLSQLSGGVEIGVLDYKTIYPNISFNNDNTFRVQQNGSTKVIVNSSGNVGIGTTSPGAKLHTIPSGSIGWSSLGNAGILIGTDTGAGIGIDQNEIASKGDHLYLGTVTANKDLILRAGGATNRLVVKGDTGNVGIGTTSPSEKLEVSGNIKIGDNDNLILGGGNDLKLVHDGSNSYLIHQGTGDLYIQNSVDDKDIIFKSDDGSGGVTEYFRLDGSLADGSNYYTKWPDNSIASFGSAPDLLIYHDGFNSRIRQLTTSDLIIENLGDDKDIIFKCDDGSGGVTEYFKVDGGTERTIFKQNTSHDDGVMALFGNDLDLRVYHDGTDSFIKSDGTGNLYLQQLNDDKDIVFQSDNGSGGLSTYFFLDGSNSHTNFQLNARWVDNAQAQFGNSGDLLVYHDGSNSYIKDAGTGNLKVMANNLYLQNATGENYINCYSDDRVEIFHNNSKKLETTSTGVEVTGDIALTGSVQRQISTTHHTFTFGAAGSASQDYWVPFIGNSELASPNVTHRTIAPYGGILKKAIVHSTIAYGSSAQVRFHRIDNGTASVFANDNSTDDVTTNVTADMSTAYSSVAFDFTTGNTFSAGDQIGVSFVRDNTGLGDVAITLVWEYELF